jgi:AbrB family looped-hinge helix DNA binding protein
MATERAVVRLSSKGQLVVPKEFREAMGLRPGDAVAVHEVSKNLLILEKLPESPLAGLTEELRKAARRKGFGARELSSAIRKARKETYAETYRRPRLS